jgi:hypothetical protein
LRAKFTALLVAACANWLPATTASADDFRLTRLEQDVLELRRDLQLNKRKIEMLEQTLAELQSGAPANRAVAATGTAAGDGGTARWINHSNWARIKPGMSELELIEILGAPSSMRRGGSDGSNTTLFYAQEIGASGFLSGTVTTANHRVLDAQAPVLKIVP